jgi:hypothetical protein
MPVGDESLVEQRQEMLEGFLEKLIGPDALAAWVLLVGVTLAIGLVSAHYLRQQRDFEHKEEMMWGAHWFWVVVLFAEVVLVGGTYLALTRTDYTMTAGFTSMLLGPTVLFAFFDRWHYQFIGAIFALIVWTPRMRGEEFDLDDWLKKQGSPPRSQRILRRVVLVMHIVLAFAYLFIVLTFAYPADRWMIHGMQAERMQPILRQRLDSEDVRSVHCFAPMGTLSDALKGQRMQAAVHSLKQIAGLLPDPEPPRSWKGYWQLFISVNSDTTREQKEEIHQRAVHAVTDFEGERFWRIVVSANTRKPAIERYHPRRTHGDDLSGRFPSGHLDSTGKKQ